MHRHNAALNCSFSSLLPHHINVSFVYFSVPPESFHTHRSEEKRREEKRRKQKNEGKNLCLPACVPAGPSVCHLFFSPTFFSAILFFQKGRREGKALCPFLRREETEPSRELITAVKLCSMRRHAQAGLVHLRPKAQIDRQAQRRVSSL